MKFFTNDQFDDFMEFLQGNNISKAEALKTEPYKGLKLTKEQDMFLSENLKRCRRCGKWRGATDICYCR